MNALPTTNFILYILKKHYKVFILFGTLSIFIGIAVSLILPKEFQSEAILFPARHFSISKMLIEPNVGNQEDYLEIGDDDDMEKLLQIIHSDNLKILLANKMNLWKRWKIQNKTHKFYYLKSKWEHYITISRTNFTSIKITVYDNNPDTAALITNTLIELIDTVQKQMISHRTQIALNIVKREYDSTIHRINIMEDSLNKLRTIGIFDYKEQVKAYAKEYAKAIAKNDLKQKENIEKILQKLEKYGGAYNTWSENLRKYRAKFAVIKYKYDQMLIDANNILPLKYIAQNPYVNNKKTRPITWLIILICFISTEIIILSYYLIKTKNYE